VHKMNVSVVGLGKIGLPLAIQIASKGHRVIGCDIDPQTVAKVNLGEPTISGEPGVEALKDLVASGLLAATTNTSYGVSNSDVVVVVVPLVVNKFGVPLFDNILKATKEIGAALSPGTLVIYETTLPVGTTRTKFGSVLEKESGLTMGEGFALAFSPERVYSGTVFSDLKQYPKLVGGVDEKSTRRAINFYDSVLDFNTRPDLRKANGVWNLGTCEAAELAKLAETTYRDVNIALANQFAVYAESLGVDIYKVLEACNSQPFSHIHQPGVAVGGHCIPVYPHFYLIGDPGASLVSEARKVNASMPDHAIQLLIKGMGDLAGKVVSVLGLAYRGGVKEAAFSGALKLAELLSGEGAIPKVHDPLFSDSEIIEMGLTPYHLGDNCDAVILQSNHSEYGNIDASAFPGASLFIDGRNASPPSLRKGIKTKVIGVGDVPFKLSHHAD